MSENAIFNLSWTWWCPEDADVESLHERAIAFIETLKQVAPGKHIFQLERGKECGRLHFQGNSNVNTKIRSTTYRTLLNDYLPGIYVEATSKVGRGKAAFYCMKADTRVAGPWSDEPIYLGQDLPTTLYPWQTDLLNICQGPWESRKIYWIFDEQGNTGKSAFAKYMAYHHDVPGYIHAKASDVLNMVCKEPHKKAYIFDLSRTSGHEHHMDDVYMAIETIKNGNVLNTKYETKRIMMMPPHIIVFSNKYPDTSALSGDRWIIKTILNGNLTDPPPRVNTWFPPPILRRSENMMWPLSGEKSPTGIGYT